MSEDEKERRSLSMGISGVNLDYYLFFSVSEQCMLQIFLLIKSFKDLNFCLLEQAKGILKIYEE